MKETEMIKMLLIIKAFFNKILKSRIGRMVAGLFSGWQLYILLAVLFGGYILKLKLSTWNVERKLENQIEKTIKLQLKYDLKVIDLKTCSIINTEVNNEVARVVEIANQCNDMFVEAKERSDAQIKVLDKKSKEYKNDIEKIKKIKAITNCDNEPLSDDVSKWLRGKKPDS